MIRSGLPLFVKDWIGHAVALRLVDGTIVQGTLTDWSCTMDGVPITLVIDGDAVVPWHAVAVVR